MSIANRTAISTVVGIFLAIVSVSAVLAVRPDESPDGDFNIRMSPAVIVKGAEVEWCTVHTDVEMSSVIEDLCFMAVRYESQCTLMEDVQVFSDDLGHLVAQVPFSHVDEAVSCSEAECELATIALVIDTESGWQYASEDVRVKCPSEEPVSDEGDFEMLISPPIIVKRAPIKWLTIHTDVQESDVTRDSWKMEVNGEEIDDLNVSVDDSGNLVVKARFEDVVECVCYPSATIKLELDADGDDLEASEVVSVRE